MPIRQVGGKSVYIIDAGTVDSAKTSTGTGYAQLVSQLRWQIWEASKEAVASQIEFEKMGYQAQLDVFAKQQAELQKSLSKLRDIKSKVASGVLDPKDALRLAIADANTELSNERNELKAAGGGSDYTITETQAKTATGKPRVDENGNPVMIRSVRYKAGEKGAAGASKAKESDAGDVATPSSRYDDILAKYGGNAGAAIDARAQDIELQLAGLKAPGVPSIDVIGRTREGFGEMAGVGGFGFARRPTKSSPIYDEAKAKRELFGADSPQNIDNLVQQMADDAYILRKTEVLSTYPAGKVLTPMEEERLRQDALVGARKKVEQAYFSESGVTAPVSARKFMTGDRDLGRQGNLPPVQTADPFEPPPEPAPVPAPRRSPPPPPQRDQAFQGFIETVEDIDIDPYKKPPAPPVPPPEILGGKAGLAPTPDNTDRSATEEELIFGGGVIDQLPESQPPSDLEIFNEIISEQDKVTSPPPAPPVIPPSPRAAEVLPVSEPGDPKITDTDIEMAIDEDPDIFRKAVDYWKASPNKDIAVNPPAYFAGKKPGEKARPGEGQKEMVRRYLIEKAKQDRTKREESLEESYLKYRDRPPINPDLARQSEGESQAFFQTVSKTDPYIEKMDPTPEEKKELYDLYEASKADMGIMSDKDVSDYYIEKLNKLRSTPKATTKPAAEEPQGSLPKTRQQRAASYALNVIQKGKALSEKPEKLARLAKTNLPEHERSKKIPEHIALVDKLYDINLSKEDVYKSTYSEIARVYEKQPKLRDAALEYLVAKNLMFGNIS